MKRILLFIIIIIFLIPSTGFAAEDDTSFESVLNDTLTDTDLSGLEGEWGAYLEGLSGKTTTDMIWEFTNGDFSAISASDTLSMLFNRFLYGVRDNIPVLVQVLVVLLMLSILKQLGGSLGSQNVSGAAYYAGYLVICGLIVSIVFNIFSMSREVIGTISTFTEYITPVLFTLLTALGGFTSASVLKPAIAGFTGGISQLITYFIFPALIADIVFVLVGNISSNISLKGFSALIDSIIKWSLGIIFIVFLGIVAIQGAGAGLFDGISIRTAKYTIDKTIPVVGGMFSDSVDTIVACSSLVKNAVGITGLLIILSILLSPVINLIINIFLFKIISAIAAPFSEQRSVDMLNGTSEVLILLLVSILTVGVMAFILIAILLGAGNVNMMLR